MDLLSPNSRMTEDLANTVGLAIRVIAVLT